MDQKKNVTIKTMILLNVINFGLVAFWAFDGAYLLHFLTIKFGLSNFNGTLIQGIGKLMIIFSLLFGVYSDYTRTKRGKRLPLMLFGSLIAVPMIFLIPHMQSLIGLIIVLTIAYFGIQFAAVPYFSLVPEVVPNEKLGTANAFFSIFGGLGTLVAYLVLFGMVYMEISKPMSFYVLSTVILVGSLITYFSIKEDVPDEPPEKLNKIKPIMMSVAEVFNDWRYKKYPDLFRLLLMNFFFWAALGAFISFFTKFMIYYVNVPGQPASIVLGVVVIVSILLAVPVGILGDKISRKGMTIFGLAVVMVGLLISYFVIGPTSRASGYNLEKPSEVIALAGLYNIDMSGTDLTLFEKIPFSPELDVNGDQMTDKKAEVLRWCLSGELPMKDESAEANTCRNAVIAVMGADHPAFAATLKKITLLNAQIEKETSKVLIISFIIISFTSIGLTICFVLTATILPTLMPDEKLGLYMGFYSSVTGLGQFISLILAGAIIDLTISNPSLGYRWMFLQGVFFLFLAICALASVKYIPKATEPTVSKLIDEGKYYAAQK